MFQAAYFNGNHGNPVTGWTDANGNLLTRWGSNDSSLQGYFDLSFMPLPPGMTTANYQVTFEAINPLYMLTESVGPYEAGSPAPSGTMPTISVPGMAAGSSQTLTVNIADSATGGYQDAIATEAAPRMLPGGGQWIGRLSQVGQTDWFVFPVRAGRTFTVVTQALDERGVPTETKALLALGVWDAFDAVGSASVGWAPGLNGWATGESWLRVGDYVRRRGADRHRRHARRRPSGLHLHRLGTLRRHDRTHAASRFRRPHRDSGHGLSPFRHGAGGRPEGGRHQHLAQ